MASADSSTSPNWFTLWDIDRTLIKTGGVGRQLFGYAFRKVTRREMRTMAPLAGRTEPVIIGETLAAHGIDPASELVAEFADALALEYEENSDLLRSRGRVLPGAAESLEAVAAADDVVSSVLTGNLQRVAAIKLIVFDLMDLVDFEVGAFGSDDSERAHLVAVAQARATDKYESSFSGSATTVVGDTINDVDAGLRNGAQVLAVASGENSVEELLAAGAHIALPNLTDATAALRELRTGLVGG